MWKIAAFVALMSGAGVAAPGCGDSPTGPPPLRTFDATGTVRALWVPVEGARVDVNPGGGSTTTDQDGRYRLPQLAGSLTLSAWKPGYYADWAVVNVREVNADFRLQPAPGIEIGQPATGRIGGGAGAGPWCGANDVLSCVVFRWTPVVTESVEMAVSSTNPVQVFGFVLTSDQEWATPPGSATMVVPVTAGTVYEVRATAAGPTEVAVTLTSGTPRQRQQRRRNRQRHAHQQER